MSTDNKIKPRYYFEKIKDGPDKLSTQFRYVADHERKWGFGPRVKEIWKEATLSEIKAEGQIQYEKEMAVVMTMPGYIPFDGVKLLKMAKSMEQSLDLAPSQSEFSPD